MQAWAKTLIIRPWKIPAWVVKVQTWAKTLEHSDIAAFMTSACVLVYLAYNPQSSIEASCHQGVEQLARCV